MVSHISKEPELSERLCSRIWPSPQHLPVMSTEIPSHWLYTGWLRDINPVSQPKQRLRLRSAYIHNSHSFAELSWSTSVITQMQSKQHSPSLWDSSTRRVFVFFVFFAALFLIFFFLVLSVFPSPSSLPHILWNRYRLNIFYKYLGRCVSCLGLILDYTHTCTLTYTHAQWGGMRLSYNHQYELCFTHISAWPYKRS